MSEEKRICKPWQEWIRNYGMRKVSYELDVSFNTVRGWVRGSNKPTDKNKMALIRLSNGKIKLDDFFY